MMDDGVVGPAGTGFSMIISCLREPLVGKGRNGARTIASTWLATMILSYDLSVSDQLINA
jgi:hypothetical protein